MENRDKFVASRIPIRQRELQPLDPNSTPLNEPHGIAALFLFGVYLQI